MQKECIIFLTHTGVRAIKKCWIRCEECSKERKPR